MKNKYRLLALATIFVFAITLLPAALGFNLYANGCVGTCGYVGVTIHWNSIPGNSNPIEPCQSSGQCTGGFEINPCTGSGCTLNDAMQLVANGQTMSDGGSASFVVRANTWFSWSVSTNNANNYFVTWDGCSGMSCSFTNSNNPGTIKFYSGYGGSIYISGQFQDSLNSVIPPNNYATYQNLQGNENYWIYPTAGVMHTCGPNGQGQYWQCDQIEVDALLWNSGIIGSQGSACPGTSSTDCFNYVFSDSFQTNHPAIGTFFLLLGVDPNAPSNNYAELALYFVQTTPLNGLPNEWTCTPNYAHTFAQPADCLLDDSPTTTIGPFPFDTSANLGASGTHLGFFASDWASGCTCLYNFTITDFNDGQTIHLVDTGNQYSNSFGNGTGIITEPYMMNIEGWNYPFTASSGTGGTFEYITPHDFGYGSYQGGPSSICGGWPVYECGYPTLNPNSNVGYSEYMNSYGSNWQMFGVWTNQGG